LKWLNSEAKNKFQHFNFIQMKTRLTYIVGFLMMPLFLLNSMNSFAQDTDVFEGTFDEHESYGYNFIGADEDDNEYMMTFQEIDEKLLSTFDLDASTLVGVRFLVTYQTTIETVKDEDGYEEDIETYTIVGLEKLN